MPSVPAKIKELFAVRVFVSAMVNVALLVGAVIANLFTLVADAAPIFGVVKIGLVAKTASPLPVSSSRVPVSDAEFTSAGS